MNKKKITIFLKQPFRILKYGMVVASFFILGCEQPNPKKSKNTISINTKEQTKPSIETLNRAIYTSRFQLDPIFTTSIQESSLLHDLFIGLMRFDKDGNIISGVANDWQTEDGKIWIIHLKPNLMWSNYAPVTAQDFVTSWQRLASNKNHSLLSDYLIYMGIKNAQAVISGQKFVTDLGVIALNENTLKIELDSVNFQLPLMLAHTALLPTFKGKEPKADETIVTNGDYKIQEITDNQITLIATEPYFYFKKAIYHKLNLPEKITDNYDIIDNPPNNSEDVNIIKLPTLCTYFYEFNFADPIMKQKNIRKAIKGMFSSNTLLNEFGLSNSSILPNGFEIESYSKWEPIIAESLLEKEGININNPLNITLTLDNQSKHKKIAENLLRTLSRSDLFKIKLNIVEWQKLLKLRTTKKFQMIRSGWCADYPDPTQFLVQFHSKSSDNKISYKNDKVDFLLEALKTEYLTTIQRNDLIAKVVEQLEEDVVILPLFQYQSLKYINSKIKGINNKNTSGIIYTKDLYKN